MKRLMVTLAVLTIAVLGTACLKIDTRHRLYLSPSGALAWSIQESDVHSDEVEASKRDEEEAQFVRAIEGGTHPAALALEQLGSGPAATRWIRSEPPFDVSTSARLERADRLANAILKELASR